MTKNIDSIERQIIEILSKVAQSHNKDGGLKDKEWTKQIKTGICKLGKGSGYSVCASNCDGADNGEWLFDLIWWKDTAPRELVLAMESEWGLSEDEIWKDFEKLLIARAKYRVFICQQKTPDDIKNLFEEMSREAQKFGSKQVSDRYLLVGFYSLDSWNTAMFLAAQVTCSQGQTAQLNFISH